MPYSSQLKLFKLMFPNLKDYIVLDDRYICFNWSYSDPEFAPIFLSINRTLEEIGNEVRIVHSPLIPNEAITLWNSHLKGRLSEIIESTPEYFNLSVLQKEHRPIIFLNIRFKDSRFWSPRANIYEFYRLLKHNYPEAYLILHGMPETYDSTRSSYIEDNLLHKVKEIGDCYFCFDKDIIEQLAAARISDVCIFPHGAAEALGIFQDKNTIILSIDGRREQDEYMVKYVSKGVKYSILYSESQKESLGTNNPIRIDPGRVLEEVNKMVRW